MVPMNSSAIQLSTTFVFMSCFTSSHAGLMILIRGVCEDKCRHSLLRRVYDIFLSIHERFPQVYQEPIESHVLHYLPNLYSSYVSTEPMTARRQSMSG